MLPRSGGLGVTRAPAACSVKMDVAFWSQQISFLFIGILVLSSVRGFLIALIRVHCGQCRALPPKLTLVPRQAFDRFSSAITSNTVALLLSMVCTPTPAMMLHPPHAG